MNRIDQIFKALRGRGGKALMPFLTAGDPDLQTTGELLPALERAGASICELGIPFSDPIADGPVIQASMTHALSQHIRTSQILEMVARQRAKVGIGIVAMVSYTIVHRHNPATFIRDAKAAGVDGFIVPDLLLEESQGLRDAVAAEGMICSFLIAPTTPIERAQRIAQASSGFVYLLSRAGITGETTALPPDLPDRVRRLRDVTDLPIAVGFGVSNADQVRQVVSVADAAIVGSAIMRRIAACRQAPAGATSGGASGGTSGGCGVVAEVERFVTELAGGLRLSA